MDYTSNLYAKDLRPYFKHLHERVMPHSQGHAVLSDFADYPEDHPVFGLYKNCGLWTRDEAAILHACAAECPGDWIDVGAHTGWTSAHISAAGCHVLSIEPMLRVPAFDERFRENMMGWPTEPYACTSDEFFATHDLVEAQLSGKIAGAVIDGDHLSPHPLRDAQNISKHLPDTGVILLHDFIGWDVQEAVEWLMDHGFQCRVYWTPHMIACCFRGNFNPPIHHRDPSANWASVRRVMSNFPFERTV